MNWTKFGLLCHILKTRNWSLLTFTMILWLLMLKDGRLWLTGQQNTLWNEILAIRWYHVINCIPYRHSMTAMARFRVTFENENLENLISHFRCRFPSYYLTQGNWSALCVAASRSTTAVFEVNSFFFFLLKNENF